MGCEFRGKIMVHLRTCRLSQEPRHGVLHDRDHIIESESTCGDTTGSFWAVCPGHFWLHVFSHLDETRRDVYLTIEVDDGLEGKCFRDVMFFFEIIKKLHVCKVVFTSILTTVSIV